MLPSKTIFDCTGQTSRFYTPGTDGDTPSSYMSPFHRNRYSSSTDSTSPPESISNTPFQIIRSSRQNILQTDSLSLNDRGLLDSQSMLSDSSMHLLESPLSLNDSINYMFDRTMADLDSCLSPNNPIHSSVFELAALEPAYDRKIPLDRSYKMFDLENYNQNVSFDTPYEARSERYLVGRKILGCHSKPLLNKPIKSEADNSKIWIPISSSSPEKIETQYKLFPSERIEFPQYITPKKSNKYTTGSNLPQKSALTSSIFSQTSPGGIQNYLPQTVNSCQVSPSRLNTNYYSDQLSPTTSGIQNLSPNRIMMYSDSSSSSSSFQSPSPKRLPYPEFRAPYEPSLYVGASTSQDTIRQGKMCKFCRKNGERPAVYLTHRVKEKIGGNTVVTCPILRALVCSACGASGDTAHTITYCPVMKVSNNGQPLQSTTITLKSTRVKSNGLKRF